jgi:hypothetical protein
VLRTPNLVAGSKVTIKNVRTVRRSELLFAIGGAVLGGSLATGAHAAALPVYRAGAVPTDSDVVIFLAQ